METKIKQLTHTILMNRPHGHNALAKGLLRHITKTSVLPNIVCNRGSGS